MSKQPRPKPTKRRLRKLTPPHPKPTETVDFWKQKAREQEKRAKDNAEAAKRLAELEESQKTEYQRLTERADAEYNRAQDAEAKLLRYEVAAETGVPATALKFLTGSSREEIEASAKDVLDLIGNAGKPRTPKPDLNQGRPARKPPARWRSSRRSSTSKPRKKGQSCQ
jgi:hypothetical protein